MNSGTDRKVIEYPAATPEQLSLVEQATSFKNEGNNYYKVGQYQNALEKYFSGTDLLTTPAYLLEEPEYESESDEEAHEDDTEPSIEQPAPAPQPEKPRKRHRITEATEPQEVIEIRAVLYNNITICHINLENYSDALRFVNIVIRHPGFEDNPKALYRKALCEEKTDKLEESLATYKQLLEVQPDMIDAQQAIPRLEKAVEELREKQKKEVLDKLKGLGNKILGKFGMSLDNFKMKKDPESGGYSIQFQQ
ncbi:putative Tetratricopeptide repeat protein 1 [Blattamonas nauphoetae]|uniref:Tetratricopeptide repeat protein 1 n=1 Tax=Blattamonas nauphoetae TaxID=2049346 RepID=A0ABQ9XYX6_9EUKA|nr:putative Tetratricopeptide repeat protein 1 [Blattamonas nauphoetae]